MKKILITGGNGYIGAGLAMSLAQVGHRVTPLCFPVKPQNQQWLDMMDEVIVGDITDISLIKELSKKDYEVIIHLVSLDHHASNGEPSETVEVNVTPLWNLLYYGNKHGALKQLIYFSTVQVYGPVQAGIIDENSPANPINAYGFTHYMCEQICDLYNRTSDINCINLRLSNSYAAPLFADANCWWLVINDLCRQAINEKKITLLSDGSPQRDFIHHHDIAEVVKLLLEGEDCTENTFNLSSGETYTIMEIATISSEVYKKKFNAELPILDYDGLQCDTAVVGSEIPRIIFDNSRLEAAIGFTADIDIETGVGLLLDYLIDSLNNN